MEKQRFVETGSSSFFGEYLYDQVVPAEHFLRQLKQIIKWERFTQKLIRLYKGGGVVGGPPFDPALDLKSGAAERDPVWLDPDRGQRALYSECEHGQRSKAPE